MGLTGWTCPACHKGNAPHAERCGHCAEANRAQWPYAPDRWGDALQKMARDSAPYVPCLREGRKPEETTQLYCPCPKCSPQCQTVTWNDLDCVGINQQSVVGKVSFTRSVRPNTWIDD